MIIDFHTHCFPDTLAPRALSNLSAVSGHMETYTDGTANGIINAMDASGIDKAVVLNIATNPEKQDKINSASIALQNDRLIVFGSVHPKAPFDDSVSELKRLKANGVKGIKFHPEYQNFKVDDPALFHLYEVIGELGLITVFHAGMDNAYLPPAMCSPEGLLAILPYFHGTPVVAAHMGGYLLWREVLTILCGTDIYFDTSFCFSRIPRPLFKAMIQKHGTEHILFGSDSPWSKMENEIRLIDSIEPASRERELILGGNAQRILGM